MRIFSRWFCVTIVLSFSFILHIKSHNDQDIKSTCEEDLSILGEEIFAELAKDESNEEILELFLRVSDLLFSLDETQDPVEQFMLFQELRENSELLEKLLLYLPAPLLEKVKLFEEKFHECEILSHKVLPESEFVTTLDSLASGVEEMRYTKFITGLEIPAIMGLVGGALKLAGPLIDKVKGNFAWLGIGGLITGIVHTIKKIIRGPWEKKIDGLKKLADAKKKDLRINIETGLAGLEKQFDGLSKKVKSLRSSDISDLRSDALKVKDSYKKAIAELKKKHLDPLVKEFKDADSNVLSIPDVAQAYINLKNLIGIISQAEFLGTHKDMGESQSQYFSKIPKKVSGELAKTSEEKS